MKSILIVDDDKSIRDSLTKTLRKEGYEIVAVEDGEAALRYLQNRPVHLILTDLRMPRIDGLQLLRAVKSNHPKAEVILMTAYDNVEIMKERVQDYIEKPLKRAAVVAAVRRAIEKQDPHYYDLTMCEVSVPHEHE